MLLKEPEVLLEFLKCAPEFTNCEVQSNLRSLLWKEIGSISPEHEKRPTICMYPCPLPGEGHYLLSPAMVPPASLPLHSLAVQFSPLTPDKPKMTSQTQAKSFTTNPILKDSSDY